MRWPADISFKTILTALSDLAAPRFCLACGCELGLQETQLCLKCRMDLPMTYYWMRLHNPMADKINSRINPEDGVYCAAAALFFYGTSSTYKNVLWQIKYKGNASAAGFFGKMLGVRLSSSQEFSDVDLVIPVPLHWKRRLRRGYNQAERIARAVAAELGASIDVSSLRRVRRTTTQTRLGMEGKASNVKGAFRCVRTVSARHVLLLDDTFTSGATLAACYEALKPFLSYGTEVSFATLSYVGQ